MIQAKENNIANSKIVINTVSAISDSMKICTGYIFSFAKKDGIPQNELRLGRKVSRD